MDMQVQPNSQSTTPAAMSPMLVNCIAYGKDGRKLRDVALDDISTVLQYADQFIWVGLHEPDEALLGKLQEEFGLHDLAIEDAHCAHQRPKIEIYDEVLFVVLHTAQVVNGKIEFGETHIFLGKNFLLTVRHGASLSYAAPRKACEQTPELMALGPSYALYSVLDFIVDNFLPIVSSFKEELHELEKEIFEDTFKREVIERLYLLKRELVTLRLAVSPMQDILNQLSRFHGKQIDDEVRPYLRDVYDHAARIADTTNTMGELLTAAMNVNLAMVSVAQNDVVKRLAGWAGLLAAPTLIASWYGMNFHNMPELDTKSGYYVLIGVTLGICTGLYFVLRRAKWL
ncbi:MULTISPECIES: magnesium/cobalt transporter CorA [unclassified Rudaea]|uniref:magnesium/cobalt transporter CorA n=1 Tax=unclassified Rudaea TaxID=2627037 RepID=UPI0020164423|nr:MULTISPECIES: magnesium/cobalt transporter CorA [unclassified Rudaea]